MADKGVLLAVDQEVRQSSRGESGAFIIISPPRSPPPELAGASGRERLKGSGPRA